jgi:hypothetical protein
VTRRGLVGLERCLFDEADLHGFVAVALDLLGLHHHARAGLDHGDRRHDAVGAEHLGHPDLLANDSSDHRFIP